MPAPQNNYLPSLAQGEVTVPTTGSLVVDTGLKELGEAVAVLAQDAVGTAASISCAKVARVVGDNTAKITIKTWAADGATAGSTAAKVGWIAVGR